MPDPRRIPDELKWRMAAEFAVRMPILYDRAFRSVVGKKYDGIEQEIWMELSRTVAGYARDIPLPSRNAKEIAETVLTVLSVIYGPVYKAEVLELEGDKAVIIVKRCPFIEEFSGEGCTGDCIFHKCLALTLATVALLNRKYSARFVRTMCTGDRQCEVTVSIEEEPDNR